MLNCNWVFPAVRWAAARVALIRVSAPYAATRSPAVVAPANRASILCSGAHSCSSDVMAPVSLPLDFASLSGSRRCQRVCSGRGPRLLQHRDQETDHCGPPREGRVRMAALLNQALDQPYLAEPCGRQRCHARPQLARRWAVGSSLARFFFVRRCSAGESSGTPIVHAMQPAHFPTTQPASAPSAAGRRESPRRIGRQAGERQQSICRRQRCARTSALIRVSSRSGFRAGAATPSGVMISFRATPALRPIEMGSAR
jgi:hypothetical protein